MKNKLNLLKEILSKKIPTFILIFIFYIAINTILNKTYLTYDYLLQTKTTLYILLFITINLIIIPSIVSITIILSIKKIKDLKSISKKNGSVSILAIFATLLGGACPHCFVGLFPAIIGLFGSTLTLSSLPLKGFEIQIISGIILTFSINYLLRETTCKINYS